ncbi:MAG: BTAD domain-containing putative transcriptional regulator [bacterium]
MRLLTLGSLSVQGADGPITGAAAQPRRLAVLVLIARGASRGTPRAKVLSLLWPDADDAQGRRAVAQALYSLRRDLGADETIAGTQVLRLNSDVVWCDASQFDQALSQGDHERAAALYTGAFLDGFRLPGAPEFERWADDERMAMEHRYHETLEALAQGADTREEYDVAARWWRRRAASEPLNARVAAATMRTLAASGDRSGALRHARVFEALVAEELAMPADREVVSLADTLRKEVPVSVRANPPSSRNEGPRSIAVLPFAIFGRRDDTMDERYWSDGLGEEILSALLEVPEMTVVARAAAFALGPTPSLAMLRELSVSHVVEGCVRRTETGLRVTVRLMEATEGRAVWWDRVDCGVDDGVATHEQIAARVAHVLRGGGGR